MAKLTNINSKTNLSSRSVIQVPEYKAPTDLLKALDNAPKAKVAWNDITPIARRDFIAWIEGAKQPETRIRRIGITRDKLLTGKRRPCCYAVVPMPFYKALGDNPKAKAAWKELTAMEKRDLTGWIDEDKDKEAIKERIKKAIAKLAKF